jgi:branched-chain amino acid transport system substrate-binding protein
MTREGGVSRIVKLLIDPIRSAATAAVIGAGLALAHPAAAQDLTIGAIMPLSGPAATYGQSFTNIVALARDALKKEGVDINVISEDGAADVPTSIAAFNKLVRINKVPVIIHAVSPVVLALGPMGERDKVVLVNSMAADPKIGKIGPHTFSTMPSYEIESVEAAKFAYGRGARKIVGIYQDTASGRSGWDVFKPAFEALGGQILGAEAYRAGATEYRAQLTRATSFNPDMIYLASYAAETGRILAQSQRMGLKVRMIGNVAASQSETLELGGAGAEGFIHAAWPFDPENGSAAMKAFGAAYRDKFGSLPTVYAATSYDALMVLGRAAKAGAKTAADLQRHLKSVGEVDGVTGRWHFDENGQVVLKTQFVEIKNGARVKLSD